MKRKSYDWEAVEKEWRTDQLSNVQIGKLYECSEGAIRKRAKKYGWKKDLAKKVRVRVREKLVRDEVRIHSPQTDEADNKPNEADDEAIVEQAASTRFEVIRSHYKRIRTSSDAVEVLMEQLKNVAITREELEEFILQETKDDKSPKRRNIMLKAVSLPQHASTVLNLTTALKNLITLERQAFGLDDKNKEEEVLDSLDQILKNVAGASRGLPNLTQKKLER
jgi:hypothetical protein